MKKLFPAIALVIYANLGTAAETRLNGVWQLSELYQNAREVSLKQPSAVTVYTEQHVIYNYYARLPTCLSPALSTGFGAYTLSGDALTEVIANDSDPNAIGITVNSTLTISDDGLSLEKTFQRGNITHREVWSRLE